MKTIALANQKGGVGKTTTAASLGIGLSRQGKKVLLIDADAQGNLTQMLGWPQPDELSPTLSTLMEKIIAEQPIAPDEGILHHQSGIHLVPANIELSALEVTLVNTMSRETVLRQYLSTVADRYDYALIDCMPSLGIIDPVQAFLGADVDMNRANEVRPIFRSLGDIAQATGCAIVLIGHLNKAAGTQSTYRGLGSIDITAAVRSLLFIGKLKDSPTTRVLIHEKSSLAPPGQSLAFSLGDEKGFEWIGAYDITADELLTGTDTAKTESNMMLSIDIIPVAMDEAVSDIRKRIMSVESDITRWQQRQNQSNNFTANIPYDLEQMRSETKEFMDDLMSRDQRMMLALVTLTHLADTQIW